MTISVIAPSAISYVGTNSLRTVSARDFPDVGEVGVWLPELALSISMKFMPPEEVGEAAALLSDGPDLIDLRVCKVLSLKFFFYSSAFSNSFCSTSLAFCWKAFCRNRSNSFFAYSLRREPKDQMMASMKKLSTQSFLCLMESSKRLSSSHHL